jgi:signal transduction histidine kinase
MTRFLPNSFRTRLILLLAGAIILSEIIAIAIVVGDHRLSESFAFDSRIVNQTTIAYGLASDTPAGQGSEPLIRLSSREQQFALQASPPEMDPSWLRQDATRAQALQTSLSTAGHGDVEVFAGSLTGRPPPWLIFSVFRRPSGDRPDGIVRPPEMPPNARPAPGSDQHAPFGVPDKAMENQGDWGYVLAAKLPNDSWLVSMARRPPSIWPLIWRASLAALIIAAIVFSVAVILAGLIVRPINRLTGALTGFGRGERQDMQPEGPEDVLAAIAAFNTMSANVTRIMTSQRHMLAAVGHDLGTPLTALRLHAESVTDPELKQRMVGIIEEMQTLTQDVLTLARQATPLEESRTIELGSLVDSLSQDLQDMGLAVTFEPADPILWRGRSDSLRRALRNLFENACQYGDHARVDLHQANGQAIITIDDNGPGIPADRLEDVLQPFTRLEESRNRRTGGSGLGLPIAQTIIDSLGGRLTLANRPEGGLRATVELPLAA